MMLFEDQGFSGGIWGNYPPTKDPLKGSNTATIERPVSVNLTRAEIGQIITKFEESGYDSELVSKLKQAMV
jgi:hypothetical protein